MMKNTLMLISMVCMAWLITSCSDDDDNTLRPPEYLTFGTFKSGCQDNCVNIYNLMIEEEMLYISTGPKYPVYEADSFPYNGHFVSMAKEKYLLTKNLKDKIPQNFYAEINMVIGDTVANGETGIYLEGNYRSAGFKHYLNTDKSKSPEYLHDLIDELLIVVDQLEE